MEILDRTPPTLNGWDVTRWSLVATLGRREDPRWNDAWTHLVGTYRPAMEAYARGILSRSRRTAVPREEAEEVVQDFLATCVEKGWLAAADARRGSFRVFVRVLLRRFTRKQIRRDRAQKRSPPGGRSPGDLRDHDAVEEATPVDAVVAAELDRGWGQIAVERSLARLREEHRRYEVVIRDLLATDGEGSPDLAERIEAKPHQLAVIRHRARRRFKELFVEELRATVADPDAFADEWRALRPHIP